MYGVPILCQILFWIPEHSLCPSVMESDGLLVGQECLLKEVMFELRQNDENKPGI